MTLEEAVRKTLIDNTGVTALVQSRIYPNIALENTQFPCVVYTTDTVPDEASYSFDGPGLARVQVILSALGRTWSEARSVADAIYTALGPFLGAQSLQSVAIEALYFGHLEDIGRDPDSKIFRFDRTMEIVQR